MDRKIVVIDDHQLFLHGMELMLSNSGADVTSFDQAEKALDELAQIEPDLVMIDLSMPGMDGFSMIRALNARDLLLPVAVVSATEDHIQIGEALNAGAMGFIPKSYDPKSMLVALDEIMAGQIHIPENIAALLNQPKENSTKLHELYGLSPRQMDVLRLLAKGYPNKRVSLILNISEDTVKFHLRGIFKALSVSNRTESVTKASELGLLERR